MIGDDEEGAPDPFAEAAEAARNEADEPVVAGRAETRPRLRELEELWREAEAAWADEPDPSGGADPLWTDDHDDGRWDEDARYDEPEADFEAGHWDEIWMEEEMESCPEAEAEMAAERAPGSGEDLFAIGDEEDAPNQFDEAAEAARHKAEEAEIAEWAESRLREEAERSEREMALWEWEDEKRRRGEVADSVAERMPGGGKDLFVMNDDDDGEDPFPAGEEPDHGVDDLDSRWKRGEAEAEAGKGNWRGTAERGPVRDGGLFESGDDFNRFPEDAGTGAVEPAAESRRREEGPGRRVDAGMADGRVRRGVGDLFRAGADEDDA